MAVAVKKKSHNKGLGRGLDALLGEAPISKPVDQGVGPRRELPIEFLSPNPRQPRRMFDKDSIEELAISIRSRGLLQPILVRPLGEDDYEIVAGERRWRAAQKAKLHNVPVIIRELTDEEASEIALIENVQRVDLNPVEEAVAYQRLANDYGRTQEEISKAVGKSRSHVANIMRLLTLPNRVLEAIGAGDISMGHAKALIGADHPDIICDVIIERGLSVRNTERLVRERGLEQAVERSGRKKENKEKTKSYVSIKDADTRALERDLSAILGLEVGIDHSKSGSGSITVKYLTLDQLDDVCRRLMGAKA